MQSRRKSNLLLVWCTCVLIMFLLIERPHMLITDLLLSTNKPCILHTLPRHIYLRNKLQPHSVVLFGLRVKMMSGEGSAALTVEGRQVAQGGRTHTTAFSDALSSAARCCWSAAGSAPLLSDWSSEIHSKSKEWYKMSLCSTFPCWHLGKLVIFIGVVRCISFCRMFSDWHNV